jgi:predicted DCC family thiol-disulfide oxidoreductase YuxK
MNLGLYQTLTNQHYPDVYFTYSVRALMVVEALQTRLKVIEDEILRLAKAGSQESEKGRQENLWHLAHDLQREARELRAEIMRAETDQTLSPILLYDGVCGFCNRLVQFTLRRDRRAIFRFAALQSALAARILARHGINPSNLDTFYVVVNPNPTEGNTSHYSSRDDSTHDGLIQARQPAESLLSRSAAVLYVLNQLGGWCRAASFFLRLVPRFLRDWTYNLVARHRYRIFGRSETCVLPSPQDRSRFLDL